MINRDEAIAILRKYNKEPFHLQHALTVGGAMKWFAEHNGYADEADYWEVVGILHDVDFELYPDQHCVKAVDLLQENGVGDEIIHSACSHGWGLVSDVEPTHPMEKILFATDELTGLIGAAAKMRPSKSVSDMEVSSLKKKFKDKKFAAGCSRDVIRRGAELMGVELDKLFSDTIEAMRSCESAVDEELTALLA